MKMTIEVPDDLYRLVMAKSAQEGRAVGEVTVELYQRYVGQDDVPGSASREAVAAVGLPEGRAIPSWFGVLGKSARALTQHDMDTIRESIAQRHCSGSRLVNVGLDTSVLLRLLTGEPQDLALAALAYIQDHEQAGARARAPPQAAGHQRSHRGWRREIL